MSNMSSIRPLIGFIEYGTTTWTVTAHDTGKVEEHVDNWSFIHTTGDCHMFTGSMGAALTMVESVKAINSGTRFCGVCC